MVILRHCSLGCLIHLHCHSERERERERSEMEWNKIHRMGRLIETLPGIYRWQGPIGAMDEEERIAAAAFVADLGPGRTWKRAPLAFNIDMKGSGSQSFCNDAIDLISSQEGRQGTATCLCMMHPHGETGAPGCRVMPKCSWNRVINIVRGAYVVYIHIISVKLPIGLQAQIEFDCNLLW